MSSSRLSRLLVLVTLLSMGPPAFAANPLERAFGGLRRLWDSACNLGLSGGSPTSLSPYLQPSIDLGNPRADRLRNALLREWNKSVGEIPKRDPDTIIKVMKGVSASEFWPEYQVMMRDLKDSIKPPDFSEVHHSRKLTYYDLALGHQLFDDSHRLVPTSDTFMERIYIRAFPYFVVVPTLDRLSLETVNLGPLAGVYHLSVLYQDRQWNVYGVPQTYGRISDHEQTLLETQVSQIETGYFSPDYSRSALELFARDRRLASDDYRKLVTRLSGDSERLLIRNAVWKYLSQESPIPIFNQQVLSAQLKTALATYGAHAFQKNLLLFILQEDGLPFDEIKNTAALAMAAPKLSVLTKQGHVTFQALKVDLNDLLVELGLNPSPVP